MKQSIIRALAASALLVVASAAAANAQAATTAPAKWAAVPAGTYKLLIQLPEQPLPATLTVKDSSGAPTATLLTEGESSARPVKVTVKGTELYVNGDAPKGPFEIVLTKQGEEIGGRWSYGGDTGKLTGKEE